MSDHKAKQIEAIRKKIRTVPGASLEDIRKDVHVAIASLTPREARLLRARFSFFPLNPDGVRPDKDDKDLREIARQLVMLKKKKQERR